MEKSTVSPPRGCVTDNGLLQCTCAGQVGDGQQAIFASATYPKNVQRSVLTLPEVAEVPKVVHAPLGWD